MDSALKPFEQRMIDVAAEFAAGVVAPNAAAWEQQRCLPPERIRPAAQAGLTGLLLAEAQGGRGLSKTAMARVMEELSMADMAYAFVLVVHNNFMNAIAQAGSPAQRQRYLPDMLSGDCLGAFLLTEPQSGSDAANVTTTARRDDGGWILNGAKAWVTSAASADLLSVYAQTDASQGWRGIAAFVIEADHPGVIREAPYSTMGAHVMGTGGFRFEDCRLSGEAVLFPPGEGFKGAMAGIDLARANVAAMCCGMMANSLDVALAHAAGRRAFGQRVVDFQGLQWQLADVATDLHAARLMAYAATRAIDAGERAAIPAAHAKKFATRAALKGIADCMQVMGADGYKHDFPLARHLACAKMAHYIDGTTEIQNVVISRDLLRPYI
ncbi:MAG: acyl-CoA dehydrogenase family protein [Alphaproteobacteria bacterium]|jgi:alkylation response protein AidB-like acyl-CoA dehydrogenase|nr:acyl-CoA dehydrogenase family protein [Alphaproteobacteria bacterium]